MQLFRGRRGISHEGGEAGREVIPQSSSQRHQPAGRATTSEVTKPCQAQESQRGCNVNFDLVVRHVLNKAANWIIFRLQPAQDQLGYLKGCSGCAISREQNFPTSVRLLLLGAVPAVPEPGADAAPDSPCSGHAPGGYGNTPGTGQAQHGFRGPAVPARRGLCGCTEREAAAGRAGTRGWGQGGTDGAAGSRLRRSFRPFPSAPSRAPVPRSRRTLPEARPAAWAGRSLQGYGR